MTRIEAIKIVRQYTSCGLIQARDLVLRLEALQVLTCQDTPERVAPVPVVHSHPGLEAVLARIATVLEVDQPPLACPCCDGIGALPDGQDQTRDCSACNGTGDAT